MVLSMSDHTSIQPVRPAGQPVLRLVLLLLLLLTAACSAPEAQRPTPTPTVPPTATPSPTPSPSATPLPSATPPPSPTPLPAEDVARIVREALEQTAALDAYRFSLNLSGAGAVGSINLGDPDVEVALFALDGAVSDADYQFTMTGILAIFLGANTQGGLQAIVVDGQSYLYGPIAFVDGTEAAWYRLTPDRAGLAILPVDIDATLDLVLQSEADFSGFVVGDADPRDDMRCRAFVGDDEATIALLRSLARGGLPFEIDAAFIDQAESTLVICEDGYVHELSLTYGGLNPDADQNPYRYDLRVTLSDLGGSVLIEVPADARELPTVPLTAPSPGDGDDDDE
jgi:hypothetical protein